MSTNTPFRILTVCTGNICRSPMAERLLQTGFDQMAPGEFTVASAGTGALVGSEIEPHVAGFIHVFGADSSNFVSRQLNANILAGQDLVLGLTRFSNTCGPAGEAAVRSPAGATCACPGQ